MDNMLKIDYLLKNDLFSQDVHALNELINQNMTVDEIKSVIEIMENSNLIIPLTNIENLKENTNNKLETIVYYTNKYGDEFYKKTVNLINEKNESTLLINEDTIVINNVNEEKLELKYYENIILNKIQTDLIREHRILHPEKFVLTDNQLLRWFISNDEITKRWKNAFKQFRAKYFVHQGMIEQK